MPHSDPTREELEKEIEELRARLQEAEEVLKAIRRGEVDAIIINRDQADHVALILAPQLGDSEARVSQDGTKYFARGVQLRNVDRVVNETRERSNQNRSLYLGDSEPAARLLQLVEAAARNNSTILLEGETGTGKSLIARWIYEHSPRAAYPFVEINCASLKGELLANELFGHVRGAFTSATDTKEGLLDVADGGTLFLDEIGDMDPAVQSQFLKVLEEKKYRRLGDTKEQRSEFRLICATNRKLSEEIQNNGFRKDLYYRINVFPIEIPPLRARPLDIPGFAQTILESLHGGMTKIDAGAMRILKDYAWPGNIRELRNVIERALLLANGYVLRPEHFPGIASSEEHSLGGSISADQVRDAIARFNGNKKRAAEYLGISRITLYRKLKNNSL